MKVGDECYLENGTACIYHGTAAGMLVVSVIYETEEAPYEGDPRLVRQVFKEPPHQRIHGDISELEATITEKRKALEELRAEHSEMEATVKDMGAAIARIPALQRVVDFQNGLITHVVRRDYSDFKIMTLEQCLAEKDDMGREKALKLVSLFGSAEGNMEFRVNHYRDGSGNWITIIPARSEDEAIALLADELKVKFDLYIADEETSYIERAITAAEKYSIPVPDDVMGKFTASKRESLAKYADRLEADAREARAKADEA